MEGSGGPVLAFARWDPKRYTPPTVGRPPTAAKTSGRLRRRLETVIAQTFIALPDVLRRDRHGAVRLDLQRPGGPLPNL